MAKAFIFGMFGLIAIGLMFLLIFGGSLFTKLATLMWRKKPEKEKDVPSEADTNDRCPRCRRDRFVGVQHYCRP